MTTTPNPTAAEFAAALSDAQYWSAQVPPASTGAFTVGRLARCYLALKAQLAESERAREEARKQLEVCRQYFEKKEEQYMEADCAWAMFPCCGGSDEHPPTHTQDCESVLAADQTTARESAENTAEDTMHDPHYDPACRRCGHVESDHGRGSRCGAPVADEDDYPRACRCAQFVPAPAQTPEPVEPSDDRYPGEPDEEGFGRMIRAQYTERDVWREGYRAGLAAEAAKHEKAEVELGEMLQVAERARDDAKAELERVRAELTEHQREFERGELESRMSGLNFRP